MDLLRAAFLLENELTELQRLPQWRRRDLDNVARASIRAMREAADRIEQLEESARQMSVVRSHPTTNGGREESILLKSRSG